MADVFISYARKDVAVVRKLHEALGRIQRDTWVDWEDIPPTAEWMREITSAIEGADAFVFVISPASVRSETCKLEIAHAVEHGKRLIPIVWEDVRNEDVPSSLAPLQWLFFRDRDDFAASFEALVRALDTDLDWVRTHTRLLVRAIEWQKEDRDSSLMLRGRELVEAESWIGRAPKVDPRPTPLQAEYIVASRKAATSRQRRLVSSLTAGIIITLVLAAVALLQRREAVKQRDESDRQRRIAVARQLSAQSDAMRGQDPRLIDRALLLGVESARRSPDAEAARALRGSLALLPAFAKQFAAAGPVYAVAFSPQGSYLAAAGDGGARVWAVDDSREVLRVAGDARELQFVQGGRYLAVAGAAAVVRVFDMDSHQEIAALRHGGRVYALAGTPDGDHLVTGSDDKTVRLWEVPTGRLLWQGRPEGQVRAVALSRDGALVASGGYDNTARVWDWRSGRLLFAGRHDPGSASMPLRIGSRDGGVHAVSFSADAKYLASGGQDHTARIWEISSGREVFRGIHADAVYAVRFSERLEYLATAGMDGTARLWDLQAGGERFRLVHGATVDHLDFGPHGRLLTTSGDGTARVWDSQSGREVARMPHSDYVSTAAYSADGTRIATGSYDGSVRVWASTAGEEAYRFVPGSPLRGVVFAPNGRTVLTWSAGEQDKDVYLWPLDSGARQLRLPHPDFVDDARYSPDGTLVASACWDGIVRVWNATTGQLMRQLRHGGRVNRVAWSPDGRSIATSGFDEGLARIWRVEDGELLAQFAQPGVLASLQRMSPHGSVRGVAFSPDGTQLATAGADGAVLLWNLARREQVAKLSHPEYVTIVVFSPNGRYVAADSGNEVYVWKLPEGTRAAVVKHDDSITDVAFSADSRYLLTTGLDRAARVWDAGDGRRVATLLHEDTVFSAEMSADGAFLLTASQDGTARIWSAATWQEVSRLNHDNIVYAARFDPTHRYFATASDDGTVRVAFVRVEDLADEACRRVDRNLSTAEWAQYLGAEPYRPTCLPEQYQQIKQPR